MCKKSTKTVANMVKTDDTTIDFELLLKKKRNARYACPRSRDLNMAIKIRNWQPTMIINWNITKDIKQRHKIIAVIVSTDIFTSPR